MLPSRLDFHVFILFLLKKKTALVPDNADLFSFLLSFLFLPARAVNIYTKPHILVTFLSLSHIFSPDRALSRRHVEPTVECAPPEKKIYYTFFSGSFVCVYFLNINMLMIFPSSFSFFYFLCGLYTSRVQLHTYFLFVKKKIVSPSYFSLFA